MTMTRKQFLQNGFIFVGAWIGLSALGCGGTAPTPPKGDCKSNGTTAMIAENTGHVLVVTKEDVIAGVDKSYNIMGNADHTHTVALSAGNFAALAGNNTVVVTTSVTLMHSHDITIGCA